MVSDGSSSNLLAFALTRRDVSLQDHSIQIFRVALFKKIFRVAFSRNGGCSVGVIGTGTDF